MNSDMLGQLTSWQMRADTHCICEASHSYLCRYMLVLEIKAEVSKGQNMS